MRGAKAIIILLSGGQESMARRTSDARKGTVRLKSLGRTGLPSLRDRLIPRLHHPGLTPGLKYIAPPELNFVDSAPSPHPKSRCHAPSKTEHVKPRSWN
jgi:hypothetical protein